MYKPYELTSDKLQLFYELRKKNTHEEVIKNQLSVSEKAYAYLEKIFTGTPKTAEPFPEAITEVDLRRSSSWEQQVTQLIELYRKTGVERYNREYQKLLLLAPVSNPYYKK